MKITCSKLANALNFHLIVFNILSYGEQFIEESARGDCRSYPDHLQLVMISYRGTALGMSSGRRLGEDTGVERKLYIYTIST